MLGGYVLLLPEPVVVTEGPLPLGAPGRGGVKINHCKDQTALLSPDPPAALESCANPIEGGSARKTEYTFFCKVKRREISIPHAIQKESTNQKGIPNNPGGIT